MFNKKLFLLLIAVVGIATSGVITQAISQVKLENQAMLALHGQQCGECDGIQDCGWCDSWGSGSEFCTGGGYWECFEDDDPGSCGTCEKWENCDMFYSCSEPGCSRKCVEEGSCSGCSFIPDINPC